MNRATASQTDSLPLYRLSSHSQPQTPNVELGRPRTPPDYFQLDAATRAQLNRGERIAGAQGRVAYRSFGVAPLEPEPSRLATWWQHRTRKQKACVLGGAAAAGTALVVGLGAGLPTAAAHRRTVTADSFSSDFSPQGLQQWNISDSRANGGSYRCGFTRNAVQTPNNELMLSITNDAVADKPTGCGQLLHDGVFGYGLFSGQIQPLAAPGVVTALFLYAETSDGINQEIDIEFVGKNTIQMWATAYRDAKPTTQSIDLGFDAATAMHNYSFNWTPQAISWQVDGQEVLRFTDNLPRYVRQSLYVSTWLRQPSDWAGQYNVSAPLPSGGSRFARVTYQKP